MVRPEGVPEAEFILEMSNAEPVPEKSRFRNVWSAAELQAENEDDSWPALMYSAFGGVNDSGP